MCLLAVESILSAAITIVDYNFRFAPQPQSLRPNRRLPESRRSYRLIWQRGLRLSCRSGVICRMAGPARDQRPVLHRLAISERQRLRSRWWNSCCSFSSSAFVQVCPNRTREIDRHEVFLNSPNGIAAAVWNQVRRGPAALIIYFFPSGEKIRKLPRSL